MQTKSKVALITGAGSGIGKSTAIALYQAGYSVVLTGRRMEKLYETVRGRQQVYRARERKVSKAESRRALYPNSPVSVTALMPVCDA